MHHNRTMRAFQPVFRHKISWNSKRRAAPGDGAKRLASSTPTCRCLKEMHRSPSGADKAKRNVQIELSRRLAVAGQLSMTIAAVLLSHEQDASAAPSSSRRAKIPLKEYSTTDDGLKYYDLVKGGGDKAVPGNSISVHFDVLYKSLDVVSTHSARLLGGNRTVAEPFEFTVGEPVSEIGIKKINDSANGLFSGQAGVKPPPALSAAVIGMQTGGKRLVVVPPELAYGDKGLQEIPPGATVQLQVELLKILR